MWETFPGSWFCANKTFWDVQKLDVLISIAMIHCYPIEQEKRIVEAASALPGGTGERANAILSAWLIIQLTLFIIELCPREILMITQN